MESKIEVIKKKLKGDILFIYIIWLAFLCLGGSQIMNIINCARISSDKFEVKMVEDGKYYGLFIEGEEIEPVDYNEYYSNIVNAEEEDGGSSIKLVYIANEVKKTVECVFMACIVLCIYLIFDKIKKGNSPFQRDSVKYLRCTAVLIICEGVIASALKYVIIIGSSEEYWGYLKISPSDIFIVILGVIVGMISEVFKYGCDLQEDSDLIA